ncbi:hypothetical protein IKQ26_06655 [bacterium]|nr:hypothetical protein [bacterium]
MNKLSNQEKREKRKNNAFFEKFAYVLAFVLLVFVGLTLFITPKEKQVYEFDKVTLNGSGEIKQDEKISADEGVNLSDIDVDTNILEENGRVKENTSLSLAQKKYIAQIKRQKMQENLRKQLSIAKSPKKLAHTLYRKNAPVITPQIQGGVEYDYNMPTPPQTDNFPVQPSEDYSFDLSASTCTPDEMEYVLNLYTSVNSRKAITLPFRRDNPSKSLRPEVINATLPNNKWKNLEDDFDRVVSSIFGEIFKEESSETNKTKVGALITTPCSENAYVSEAFYVSDRLPQKITLSSAKNYCASRHGRLPDILEAIAILKHKKLQSGYYMTNSQILSMNNNGTKTLKNDFIVMQYQNGEVNFLSSSKLPQNQQVWGECVLK